MRKRFLVLGMICALTFGALVITCENGNTPDTWSPISKLSQLDGSWKLSINESLDVTNMLNGFLEVPLADYINGMLEEFGDDTHDLAFFLAALMSGTDLENLTEEEHAIITSELNDLADKLEPVVVQVIDALTNPEFSAKATAGASGTIRIDVAPETLPVVSIESVGISISLSGSDLFSGTEGTELWDNMIKMLKTIITEDLISAEAPFTYTEFLDLIDAVTATPWTITLNNQTMAAQLNPILTQLNKDLNEMLEGMFPDTDPFDEESIIDLLGSFLEIHDNQKSIRLSQDFRNGIDEMLSEVTLPDEINAIISRLINTTITKV